MNTQFINILTIITVITITYLFHSKIRKPQSVKLSIPINLANSKYFSTMLLAKFCVIINKQSQYIYRDL